MTSPSPEQTIIDNSFGIVTNKRVTYTVKRGWFSRERRVDIPLKQVVSVSYETSKDTFLGIFYIVLGLVLLVTVIGSIISLWAGISYLLGVPTVNVVTAGGTASPVRGLPWQQQEAEAFTNALRNQLFSE